VRDVRRLIVAGPWPFQVADYLASVVVISWPLALRSAEPPYPAFPGLAVGLVLTYWQRRQDARDTGWTAYEQYDVVRRAYAGDLPADPADRGRLRRVLARYAKDGRILPWVELVGFTAIAAMAVAWRNTFRGWSEWPVAAYFLLLAVATFVFLRRKQARRSALLAELEGVGRPAGG
jgi:hypothetical protein